MSRSGFTLIELCLVLVLIAVLAMLAAPSLAGTVARSRVRGTMDRLSADLYLARSLAARAGRPYRVRFEPAAGCADRYEIVDADGVVARAVTVGPEVTGVCLSSNVATAIHVNARGMLVGSPRVVRAVSGDAGDSATLSMVGRLYRW